MRPLLSCLVLLTLILFLSSCGEKITDEPRVAAGTIEVAAGVAGLELTRAERDLMGEELAAQREGFQAVRKMGLKNWQRPALCFDPELLTGPPADLSERPSRWSDPGPVTRPADDAELAFMTVAQLGRLIATRQLGCEELTRLSLDRFKEHDPQLLCTVTLLEERALARARQLDDLLDEGEYLGPLHGIPYGAKDLLTVAGARTTWGAEPYKDQTIPETATIIRKLDEAGAVLVAKTTLGALAMGDVWFGGTTRNPWNPEQGSSGSSAGSASAVAAGLVPFAIGTETLGSIVSPSTRCGTTGLRPTFGRVSKAGAMALSWSMDKIGPIARHAEDCALVLEVIRGADPADPTAVDRPFGYTPEVDLSGLRIAYLEEDFAGDYPGQDLDAAALQVLRDLGAELQPIRLALDELGLDDPWAVASLLTVEAAAAFQELTLSGRDDMLTAQHRYAWPNYFRAAYFVPAVEYVQANRARVELMRLLKDIFAEYDLYVTPSFQGSSLVVTNLTGHPQMVVPAGFVEEGRPHTISFVGDLYGEATILAVARAYQEATGWDEMHPPGF
jgi:Asp-tRNA(Asn)/Glu-tRNA(Gln) amidotransferase A subunit family amidase